MLISEPPDDSPLRQLVESVDREHRIQIQGEADRIEIWAPVANDVIASGAVEDPVAGVDRSKVPCSGWSAMPKSRW